MAYVTSPGLSRLATGHRPDGVRVVLPLRLRAVQGLQETDI